MPYVPSSKKKLPTAAQMQAVTRAEMSKALTDTGRYVRAKAATYPPKPDSSSYKRTGTLGKSITVGKPEFRAALASIDVGTNLRYARWVEEGTGIFGPEARPITPKVAKVLAWKSAGAGHKLIASGMKMRKGKLKANRKADTYLVFARSVKGMKPWHYMRKAFTDPASEAYFKTRIAAGLTAIKRTLGVGA